MLHLTSESSGHPLLTALLGTKQSGDGAAVARPSQLDGQQRIHVRNHASIGHVWKYDGNMIIISGNTWKYMEIDGNIMAMSGTDENWRYLPYIRPKFQGISH